MVGQRAQAPLSACAQVIAAAWTETEVTGRASARGQRRGDRFLTQTMWSESQRIKRPQKSSPAVWTKRSRCAHSITSGSQDRGTGSRASQEMAVLVLPNRVLPLDHIALFMSAHHVATDLLMCQHQQHQSPLSMNKQCRHQHRHMTPQSQPPQHNFK